MRPGSRHSAQAIEKQRAARIRYFQKPGSKDHLIKWRGVTCRVGNCTRPAIAKGFCGCHWKSNQKYGDPLFASSSERKAQTRIKLLKRSPYWLGKTRQPHSAETRLKMSASHKVLNYRGRGHHLFGVAPPHRAGIRYCGRRYRSRWEVRLAKLLRRAGIRFHYEEKTFDLGDTTYTPDFFLPSYHLYLEVKGWLTSEAERKVALFRSRYPEERLVVIPSEFFRKKLDQPNWR